MIIAGLNLQLDCDEIHHRVLKHQLADYEFDMKKAIGYTIRITFDVSHRDPSNDPTKLESVSIPVEVVFGGDTGLDSYIPIFGII
jgi:hypothetical protein